MAEKIIIANWKMNPGTLLEAEELFSFEAKEAARYFLKTIFCPPAIFLEGLFNLLSDFHPPLAGVFLGAQDLFWEKSGPFTGEVSPLMFKNLGVTHVLVGHSERRYILNETDEMIRKKIKTALSSSLVPVVFIGERNDDEKKAGVLEQQTLLAFDGLTVAKDWEIFIVYEPVWAISSQTDAVADTPQNALAAIKVIKSVLAAHYPEHFKDEAVKPVFRFFYGGSVNVGNTADFLKHPEIEGVIVGGASLQKYEFSRILKIASEL